MSGLPHVRSVKAAHFSRQGSCGSPDLTREPWSRYLCRSSSTAASRLPRPKLSRSSRRSPRPPPARRSTTSRSTATEASVAAARKGQPTWLDSPPSSIACCRRAECRRRCAIPSREASASSKRLRSNRSTISREHSFVSKAGIVPRSSADFSRAPGRHVRSRRHVAPPNPHRRPHPRRHVALPALNQLRAFSEAWRRHWRHRGCRAEAFFRCSMSPRLWCCPPQAVTPSWTSRSLDKPGHRSPPVRQPRRHQRRRANPPHRRQRQPWIRRNGRTSAGPRFARTRQSRSFLLRNARTHQPFHRTAQPSSSRRAAGPTPPARSR